MYVSSISTSLDDGAPACEFFLAPASPTYLSLAASPRHEARATFTYRLWFGRGSSVRTRVNVCCRSFVRTEHDHSLIPSAIAIERHRPRSTFVRLQSSPFQFSNTERMSTGSSCMNHIQRVVQEFDTSTSRRARPERPRAAKTPSRTVRPWPESESRRFAHISLCAGSCWHLTFFQLAVRSRSTLASPACFLWSVSNGLGRAYAHGVRIMQLEWDHAYCLRYETSQTFHH